MENQDQKRKEHNVKHVALTITHKCNLNCVYCYEKYKNDSIMTFEIAKGIIINCFNESSSYDEIEFSFHGGEPFLAFDLIKKICEWTWEQKWNKKYYFSATTNGTVISDTVKRWLDRHKDNFIPCLSLDGTPQMHDKNRCNSFSLIDPQYFLNNWPKQPIKMTVSTDTKGYFADGVIWLSNFGFKIGGSFAYGQKWDVKTDAQIVYDQFKKLTTHFLQNLGCELPGFFYDPISLEGVKNDARKTCGAGREMVAYDVDGKSYPCQFFLPFSIGNETLAQNCLDIDFMDATNVFKQHCINCEVKMICQNCMGSNYAETGDIGVRSSWVCEITKIRAVASMQYWHKKLLEQDSVDMQNRSKEQLANNVLRARGIKILGRFIEAQELNFAC